MAFADSPLKLGGEPVSFRSMDLRCEPPSPNFRLSSHFSLNFPTHCADSVMSQRRSRDSGFQEPAP